VLEFHRVLDGRSWNPAFRWHERRAPLLVVETDAGLAGVGEAWSRQAHLGFVLDDLAGRCAPALLGADPEARAELMARLPAPDASVPAWVYAAAASAIDLALWDLMAQATDQPMWRALGGPQARARVYASGGLYRDGTTSIELAHEMSGYVHDGYTAVKMKIGALERAADLERVRAVRDAVGSRTTLWVDAVNQLDRTQAPAWCDALREIGVAAIQAPLRFDDIAGMAQLNAAHLPVIAAESAHREETFAELLDERAVTHLQFCLGLCGGFTGAARLDALARQRGVTSTPHCFSTAVLQAASLHFAAAHANVVQCEVHRFHDHLAAAQPAAMHRVEAGCIELDDTPGLGVPAPAVGPQPGGGHIRIHRQVSLHEASPS
jgi:L-alanine-DL-glutamate epimerase-like enolase superfamily enzyme